MNWRVLVGCMLCCMGLAGCKDAPAPDTTDTTSQSSGGSSRFPAPMTPGRYVWESVTPDPGFESTGVEGWLMADTSLAGSIAGGRVGNGFVVRSKPDADTIVTRRLPEADSGVEVKASVWVKAAGSVTFALLFDTDQRISLNSKALLAKGANEWTEVKLSTRLPSNVLPGTVRFQCRVAQGDGGEAILDDLSIHIRVFRPASAKVE